MRKRNQQSATSADVEPPVPEAQGDGEPSPAEVRERANAEGRSRADSEVDATITDQADETAELKQQIEEQRDKYLRLAAEYDNYRRRTTKERLESSSRGQAELVG